MYRIGILIATIILLLGCNSPKSAAPANGGGGKQDGPAALGAEWQSLNLNGGFVPSIQFHPDNPSEIWISGDDQSGLFKSIDNGGSWQAISKSSFTNHSTYSLRFDPTDSNIIYAPHHFGGGMYKSTDGGVNWAVKAAGLPSFSTNAALHDFLVSSTDTKVSLAATEAGLYRSSDSADSYQKISSAAIGAGEKFFALHQESGGDIYAGSESGAIYLSTDNGVTWSLFLQTGLPVSALTSTDHALYVGYNLGVIGKFDDFQVVNYTTINDPSSGGFASGLWTKLQVISGSDTSTDVIYAGTAVVDGSTDWGFYVSTDGGTSFTKRMSGVNYSIFAIAVDPRDSDTVMIGTTGGGVFLSHNQGVTWTERNQGLYAHSSMGYAVSSDGVTHLHANATGLPQGAGLAVSQNGGSGWQDVSGLPGADFWGLHIDPNDNSHWLLGSFNSVGVFRSTNGANGPFEKVIDKNVSAGDFRRDTENASLIYSTVALYRDPGQFSDLGVYVSRNNGASWSQKSFGGFFVSPHPLVSEKAVASGDDIYETSDAFDNTRSLGANSLLPGKNWTAVAYNQNSPEKVVAGTETGELVITDNVDENNPVWRQLSVPFTGCQVTGIVYKKLDPSRDEVLLISCSAADMGIQSSSQFGVYVSEDHGASWKDLSDANSTNFPATSKGAWRITEDPTSVGSFYISFWGSGTYRLNLGYGQSL